MMNERKEHIIQLEQDAEALVENLNNLYKRAGSYKQAEDMLNKANEGLLTLVSETQSLAVESHRIISEINKIGGSEILRKLDAINELQSNNANTIMEAFEEMQKQAQARGNKLFYTILGTGAVLVILQVLILVLK